MTHLKGEVVGVAMVNGIIDVLDPDDWNDGAKRLLPGNAHVLQANQLTMICQVQDLDQTLVLGHMQCASLVGQSAQNDTK